MKSSAFLFLALGAAISMAQDVKINSTVNGSDTTGVLKVTNSTTATDVTNSNGKPAIWAVSRPSSDRGVGVKGESSHWGIYGVANGSVLSNTNTPFNDTRKGVYGEASDGFLNRGVAGFAFGGNAATSSNNSGGYFEATGAATNYGIYASTGGSGTNYAGYFQGNGKFTGNLYANAVYQTSDSLVKTNIVPMPVSLDKVMSLKPKKYDMKTDEFAGMNLPTGKQYGLLAQDVATVFPELVSTFTISADEAKKDKSSSITKFEGINYTGLIPILIEALQEQQAQIKALQQQVNALSGGKSSGNSQ